MVSALRREHVEAEILTTDDHGPDQNLNIRTGTWIHYNHVPVMAFRRWRPPLRALREYAFSPGFTIWLHRHIHKYDLLHVHALFSYPSTCAMMQARLAGKPYILRSIGQLSPWSLARSPRRKQWMLRLIERGNLQAAAALHFTTEAEYEETKSLHLTSQPLVIPLGVDVPPASDRKRRLDCDGDVMRLLFLSRIHPKKQLERLLEALSLYGSTHPGCRWELRIAGSCEPDYRRRLERLMESLNIQKHCHWLGFLEGEAKWTALKDADWFVLPSASENFGIAVVEALAAGTPVIVSPQVAVAETIHRAGAGLVADSRPESLALAIHEARSRNADVMALAARQLAREHFSWASIAGTLKQTYSKLLDPTASS
jgi:glycosyltransferase involved in cell wall biosynthesis